MRSQSCIFIALVVFIVAVAVHDTVLVILHEQQLAEMERNPVGRWLIELGGGDVGLLVAVKLVGAATACAVLVTLYGSWRESALAAAVVLACLQLGLLLYLSLARGGIALP
jgi:hypothetical protein